MVNTKLLLLFLLTSLTVNAEEMPYYPRVPSEKISVNGVELGSSDNLVVENLGNPISKTNEPPQFGDIETTYRYEGMRIHTTDNSVELIDIYGDKFKLKNGVFVGMPLNELKKSMKLWWNGSKGHALVGKSDSCFVFITASGSNVEKIRIYCAG